MGVFNTAFVGDLALMSRLIDALHLGGHEVILFSNAAGCSLYEYDLRIARRVLVRKQRGLKKAVAVRSIANQIHQENLDVLVLAHRSVTSGVIALLSRQRRIISFSDGSFLRLFFELRKSPVGVHESERYLGLASGLVSEENIARSRLSLSGDRSLRKFSQIYSWLLSPVQHQFFLCAPGSVWQTKKYPPRLLAKVIGRLLMERAQLYCVLSGGPSDHADISEVVSEFRENKIFAGFSERVLDARDCLPLAELIELTRRAAFVLTPDSAPLHVASATGTRTFAFFGPTPADTGFSPLSAGSRVLDTRNLQGRYLSCQPCSKHGQSVCPLGHHGCLADLPPNVVADHVLESLPT